MGGTKSIQFLKCRACGELEPKKGIEMEEVLKKFTLCRSDRDTETG